MYRELSNGVITLKPYSMDLVDAVYEAARESIGEVHPWLPWCHPAYSRDESRGWIVMQEEAWRNDTSFEFAMLDAKTGRFLGGCGINQVNRMHRYANLGYWIRTSQAGKGFTTAATRMVARFGLEELALTRIEIIAAVGNLASRRVAEKAGAHFEGILRNRLVLHGVAHDAAMTSLTPEDLAHL